MEASFSRAQERVTTWTRRGLAIASTITAAAILCASAAHAQSDSYPQRPIRILVGGPAGGTTDVMARLLAREVANSLGQQGVVENRAGANGLIATQALVAAPPDGYTLSLAFGSSLDINPLLMPNYPIDTLRDLTPIAMISTAPLAIVVHPSVPVRTVGELVSLLKSKPGVLNYGATGGGPMQLFTEKFQSETGTKMQFVPYKGSAQVVQDLLGAQLQVAMEGIVPLTEHVKAGSLRMIAVASRERLKEFPDVPTVAESGVPGFEAFSWYALVGPRGMPEPLVQKLNSVVHKLLANPEALKTMQTLSAIPAGPDMATPQQLSAYIKKEQDVWRELITRLNIKPY